MRLTLGEQKAQNPMHHATLMRLSPTTQEAQVRKRQVIPPLNTLTLRHTHTHTHTHIHTRSHIKTKRNSYHISAQTWKHHHLHPEQTFFVGVHGSVQHTHFHLAVTSHSPILTYVLHTLMEITVNTVAPLYITHYTLYIWSRWQQHSKDGLHTRWMLSYKTLARQTSRTSIVTKQL